MLEDQRKSSDAVEHITKRFVARATLSKIQNLVSKWQEEEKQDAYLLKMLPILFFLILVFLFFLIPNFFRALNSHPKIQLMAISIPIGLVAAIALNYWSKRSCTKDNSKDK